MMMLTLKACSVQYVNRQFAKKCCVPWNYSWSVGWLVS